VSFGIYPLDLWHRILQSYEVDAGLVHNHYCLNDTGLMGLLPIARSKNIGIINGSPFASGLLTERGPAAWHPASPEDRAVFRKAAEFCQREWGAPISKLALQYSSQHPAIPTTLFSSSNPDSVRRNVLWHEEPLDIAVVIRVQGILGPVMDKQWTY
jgi:aryl-alcohol dehydrogenase-like predicted oxidoreductase